MAKSSGLGDQLLVAGYDLGEDIGSLGNIGGGPATLDVTPITKSAHVRIGGTRDGRIEYTAFFNPSTNQAHDRLSDLPTTDQLVTYLRGTGLGSPAANLVGKQINYDPNRGDDGSLTFAVSTQANGYGLEWCDQLTAGIRTDTTATNGTGVDLGTTGSYYLSLPGTSGNYASTPDAAALDITGDIDIRAKVAPADWTPAAEQYIISKYTTTGNQRSYALSLDTTGGLILRWSADGTTGLSASSTANLSTLTDGSVKWVRATLDVNDGGGNRVVVFYTSDDGTTWTQLGSTVTTAGTTSIFASTAVLEIGSHTGGTAGNFTGKFFQGDVKNGIAGTSVSTPVAGASSISDAAGPTWTVNGTAFLANATTYGLQAYLQVTGFTGTTATIKLQESADNGGADAWADVLGGAFTAVTAGPTWERIQTARAQVVERYLRVVTTGTFSSLSFLVSVARNDVSTVF